MGACVSKSHASEDGTSTSRLTKFNTDSSNTNPARVLQLGPRCESYFARFGGREFYASPPVTREDLVDRTPGLAERNIEFKSKDGTVLAGVVHFGFGWGSGGVDAGWKDSESGLRSANEKEDWSEPGFRNPDAASPYESNRVARRKYSSLGIQKNNLATSSINGVGVVLCHPHPFLGGGKDSPLLVALARRLANSGVVVLRFDSRGVGNSSGKRTWMRDAEIEDVAAAVRWLGSRQRDGTKKGVFVVGYGLGAAVGLEATRREFLAAGFVGISYPFHAKSMLVPAAVAVHSIHSFNDREGNQQGTTQGTTQTKPTLFIVAGADVVGSAGDATFAANFARKLPPPRAVVVVDDADHSWCGCYFTCYENVLEFLEEHYQRAPPDSATKRIDAIGVGRVFRQLAANKKYNPRAASSNSDRDTAYSDDDSERRAVHGHGPDRDHDDFETKVDRAFATHKTKSSDSTNSAPSEDWSRDERERERELLSSPDTSASPSQNRPFPENRPKRQDTPNEVLAWEREVRSRARAVGTAAGGRPLGPLRSGSGRLRLEKQRKSELEHSGESAFHAFDHRDSEFPDSPTGAMGEGGFETWHAWEREKQRRRDKMGSPGHTPAASHGSRQTPGTSPGHTPFAQRSFAGDARPGDVDVLNPDASDTRDAVRDLTTSKMFDTPSDPWALNGASPLIQRGGSADDIPTKAAQKLAMEVGRRGSETGSDADATWRSRASNRPPAVPADRPSAAASTASHSKDSHSNTSHSNDSKASSAITPLNGSNSNRASPSSQSDGVSLAVGTQNVGNQKTILKKTSSYVNLAASLPGESPPPDDPHEPSLLKVYTNASTKTHGRPNFFRSGIRAVLAANRFVAAGQKRVQWEAVTAEGRPILDSRVVLRKTKSASDRECDRGGGTARSGASGGALARSSSTGRAVSVARTRTGVAHASATRSSSVSPNKSPAGSSRGGLESRDAGEKKPGVTAAAARAIVAESRGRDLYRASVWANSHHVGPGAGAGAGPLVTSGRSFASLSEVSLMSRSLSVTRPGGSPPGRNGRLFRRDLNGDSAGSGEERENAWRRASQSRALASPSASTHAARTDERAEPRRTRSRSGFQ